MNFIKNRMANSETTKATTVPTNNVKSCGPTNRSAYLISFNPLAPSMTGIARKNENYAATVRVQPSITAPKIVAPDRDVPGISAST